VCLIQQEREFFDAAIKSNLKLHLPVVALFTQGGRKQSPTLPQAPSAVELLPRFLRSDPLYTRCHNRQLSPINKPHYRPPSTASRIAACPK